MAVAEQKEQTGVDESLEVAALKRQLAEKDQIIAAQSRQLAESEEYTHQMHTVLTNGGMSHRDRVTWCVAHIIYGKDIMAGRPFRADMAKIQKMAGVGKNATGELFAAMAEAGGIKHDWDREKYQEEGADRDSWSSAVVITPLPGNALVNTKDTDVRQRQREASAESAKRRVERLISVAIEACPHCGCEDPEMAQTLLVPRCKACGKLRNSDNLVQTSTLRILEIEEEPVQVEIETSSVQAASSSEAPTSQDTPSVDNYASELDEIPDEPDDVRSQYEEVSADRETSNAVPLVMVPVEDKETFRRIVTLAKARGLDTLCGASMTYREVLTDLQPIIKSEEPVKSYTLEWVRHELAKVLETLSSDSSIVEGSNDA